MRHISALALGLAGAALWVGVGLAAIAPGALDVVFKNTIKITSSAGEEFIYFNPDKTFNTTGPGGDTAGLWRINGDQICTKTKDAAESCGVIEPNRVVGDHWEHKLNGETVTVEIIKGR